MSRPCRFCTAAYPEIAGEICEQTHRDEQRVYDLATALAAVFQHRPPTDEQVGWFVDDADAVVDDFDPVPAKWRVRRLPFGNGEFDVRMRINDVTYVCQPGDKSKALPVRLSVLRGWQREANAEAARRLAGSQPRRGFHALAAFWAFGLSSGPSALDSFS